MFADVLNVCAVGCRRYHFLLCPACSSALLSYWCHSPHTSIPTGRSVNGWDQEPSSLRPSLLQAPERSFPFISGRCSPLKKIMNSLATVWTKHCLLPGESKAVWSLLCRWSHVTGAQGDRLRSPRPFIPGRYPVWVHDGCGPQRRQFCCFSDAAAAVYEHFVDNTRAPGWCPDGPFSLMKSSSGGESTHF